MLATDDCTAYFARAVSYVRQNVYEIDQRN